MSVMSLTYSFLGTTALSTRHHTGEALHQGAEKNVGEYIMARKIADQTSDQAAKALNDQYNEAAEPALQEEYASNINSNLHYLLTSTLGSILLEYYDVGDISLDFAHENEDNLGQIYVRFREDISYTGAEKLEILAALSKFIKDVDETKSSKGLLEINADTSDCIFEITYQPVCIGKLLCQLLVKHDPANVPIGNNLADATSLIERAEIPACRLH